MVKPDSKHDYYADLELPTDCSIEDVKKQYHKLARLYHPDRNAGKEEEYVPKFQAIQTAHEILGDPGTKQKYDSDRRGLGGAGKFRSSQPTPGNPYAATSAYPPPPRRTQPGTWQRPQSTASNTPSGADRFSNFGKGAPTAKKDPVQDRANIFRAWQNMPSGGKTSPGPSRSKPPQPPRANVSAARSTEEDSRPRTTRRSTKPSQSEDYAEHHQSAWAASQKSNQGRPNFGRTTSTPKKAGFNPNTPGSDERPAPGQAYMHRTHADNLMPEAAGAQRYPAPPPPSRPARSPVSPSTPSQEQPPPFADPLKAFKTRQDSDDIPFAEANRLRTPYSTFSGERTTFSADGLRRSASTRDTTKLGQSDENPNARAKSSSPARNKTQPPGTKKSFVSYGSTESSDVDSESDEPNPSTDPADRPKKIPKRPSIRINRNTTSQTNTFNSNGSRVPGSTTPDKQQKSGTNIFTFPIFPDTFSPTGKSRSEENINTKFSQDNWDGPFQGSQDKSNSFQPNQRKTQSPGAKYRPRPTHRTSTTSQMGNPSPMYAASGENGASTAEPVSNGFTFDQVEWEKNLKDSPWAWTTPPRVASPTRYTSKPKTPVRKPVPGGASDVSNRRSYVPKDYDHQNLDNGTNPDRDDAMDIDPVPPVAPSSLPTVNVQATPQEPRLYSVPPSAWRQQQQQGTFTAAETSMPNHVQPPPQVESLKTNLDDLRHVEPMVGGGDGLSDFGDLAATLPFTSQASSQAPGQPSAPQKLRIPELPRAPLAPARLTRGSWVEYAQNFGNYIKAYHVFESILLQHFVAREREFTRLTADGMGWVGAVGDVGGGDSTRVGFASYLKGRREDAQAREAWSIGAERHTEALTAFEQLRERVKHLVSIGALTE